MDLTMRLPDWPRRAACREADPDLFHDRENESEPARERREKRAKAVCARCPVRAECLADAEDTREAYGIRGGLTEAERRAIRRNCRRAQAAALKAAA
jgi:WhiB family redox-sensing transcriptional regulator